MDGLTYELNLMVEINHNTDIFKFTRDLTLEKLSYNGPTAIPTNDSRDFLTSSLHRLNLVLKSVHDILYNNNQIDYHSTIGIDIFENLYNKIFLLAIPDFHKYLQQKFIENLVILTKKQWEQEISTFIDIFDDMHSNSIKLYEDKYVYKLKNLNHLYRSQNGSHIDLQLDKRYSRMIPNENFSNNNR